MRDGLKRAAVAALAAPLLVACGTMSQRDCRYADWNALGRQDGEHGEPLSKLAERRESCAWYGIEPRQAEYLAAREAGLRSYCTPLGGYLAGREGGDYHRVCGPPHEIPFLDGFHSGRRVFHVLSEVRELRLRADETELAALGATLEAGERERSRRQLADLERRYEFRRLDLERLDGRLADRFGAPPLAEGQMRY